MRKYTARTHATTPRRRQQGQAVVRTAGNPPPRPERVTLLIVGHADGWFEVFSNVDLDVRFVNRLCVGQAEAAPLLDEHIALALPPAHRRLYEYTRARFADQVRKIRPSDEAARLLDVDLLAEVRAIPRTEPEAHQ